MSEIPDAPHSALHDLNKQIVKPTASIADDADSGPETADSSAAALWEIARELRKIRRELESIRRKK